MQYGGSISQQATVTIQGVSKVTPDFIQLKSQWIFFYDIFYIYAFSNHFYCYVVILCSYTTYQKYKFVL